MKKEFHFIKFYFSFYFFQNLTNFDIDSYMPIIFVMQGKCPFSDISRPEDADEMPHNVAIHQVLHCFKNRNTKSFENSDLG